MAKKRTTRRTRSTGRSTTDDKPVEADVSFNDDEFAGGLEADGGAEGETTGRMLVTVLDGDKSAVKTALKTMSNMTGLSATSAQVMYSSDTNEDGFDPGESNDANFVVLEELGVVIMNCDPDAAVMAASATPQDENVVVEAEHWNHPLGSETLTTDLALDADSGDLVEELELGGDDGGARGNLSRDFLLGARSMLDLLLDQDESGSASGDVVAARRCFRDTSVATWGLHATNVVHSPLGGRGVRVAVLDTGFDARHPDFRGRTIRRASFIPASEPDNDSNDRNGHGTHCIGTACGPLRPGIGPRYGIAHQAEIFSGKVLRNRPDGRASGADGWILSGINWALRNRCQVISMSLGSRATSSSFPMAYERAARAGLRNGSLILAATGNDSRRPSFMDAVGRPANCPSIAAVSALDSCRRVASFSNGQRFGNGGEVNFTGPGVAVLSSVPMPRRRAVFDGTSMATPHAAGIAALICGDTGQTGIDLYREMRRRAVVVGPRRDFGNGLVRI